MKAWHQRLLLLLACITTATSGQAAAAPSLDYSAIFEFQVATAPAWSPAGDRLVYIRRFNDVMTDGSYSNLWIIGADGHGHRQLTSGQFRDEEPLWMPDGRSIIFKSNRSGTTQIHKVQVESGAVTKLSAAEFAPFDLSLSPDGKLLCYVAFVPSAPTVLAEIPEPPEGASWAPPATTINRLIYRYDGRGNLPNGYFHLFLLPTDGGTARQLTKGDAHHTLFYHAAQDSKRTAPVWMPDGRHLLFVANMSREYEYQVREFEIHKVFIDSGNVVTLTTRRGPDFEPVVSPDGSRIAYVGFDDAALPHQDSRLYVMNADGTDPEQISRDLSYSIESPHWLPDGKGLVFGYIEEGEGKLGRIDLQGNTEEIARNVGSPASRAAVDYDIAENGRFAYPYADAAQGGNLAIGELGQRPVRIITKLNASVLSEKIGETEEFWASSSDGRKIQGWLIHPPDFDPARKYPLVVYLHGGPAQAYGDRFDLRKQLMASREYVVMFMNFRGSTSYGEEFANAIHDRFPEAAYDDVIASVEEIAERSYIDAGNMFLFGGSAGGQLVLWVLGQTDRFRAAVALFPVTNRYSAMLTVDRPMIDVMYRYGGVPWRRPGHFTTDLSPLSLVGNVTTPVLLMAGENDFRVRVTESEQYYMALKLQKKDAMLMTYPDESHGIGRRPSHQYSLLINAMKWFETYRGRDSHPGGQ